MISLVSPGVVAGLILKAAFIRFNGPDEMGIPLSNVGSRGSQPQS
jgi:hypothetical protein